MNEEMIIANAIGSNGFTTDDTTAGLINPEYWDRNLMAYLTKNLVVADKAKVFDNILGQDGDSFHVTIDATPTAAAAVAETDDITVSAFETMTQVTFTPTEYGKAYQLHDKEARRGFINAMENMTQKLGYALALGRDSAAVTLLQGGAGNSYVVNGVAASALASSDKLDYATIVRGCRLIKEDLLVPKYLFVNAKGFEDLSLDQNFKFVEHAGTDETLRAGRIGRIYGLDVYETTQIAVSNNVTKAIVLAVDQMGEPVFGIGRKLLPELRTQSWALGRYTDIRAVEEWDMKILRANGICTLSHYE